MSILLALLKLHTMSFPLSACLIARAAKNEPGARKELERRSQINLECGAFSVFPCPHDPPHKATEEEIVAMLAECPTFQKLLDAQ